MSEFQVVVVQIGRVEKHPGADNLSITYVHGGYPCIIRTGDFQEGDRAAYIPVDSLCPLNDMRFVFLKKESSKEYHRVKAIRLRGIFSMGLLIPAEDEWQVGQNIQEELRIRKYEPPEAIQMGGENEQCPFQFPVYTDVEGLRKWHSVFQDGEQVAVSEKIHGCLTHKARITMADGSRKPISRVKVGDEVLGVDNCGRVVAAPVVQVFHNGETNCWLNIKGPHSAAGRGSPFFRLRCTPEHRFWDPALQKFIEAKELKLGQSITILRSELELTPLQRQIIIGKMLGNGSFHDHPWSGYLSWAYAEKDKEYFYWTNQIMGELCQGYEYRFTGGYGAKMLRSRTISSAHIKKLLSSFFTSEQKKQIPSWVADEMGPISMAILYMDYGSLSHHKDQEDRVHLAVCDYSSADCEVLQRGMKKFGINAVYYESEGHSRLRLNANDAELFFLLISPYVPSSMQYKLPQRYRGHAGWFPRDRERAYGPLLVTQTILEIEEEYSNTFECYDLETQTHNYFANGCLVHNSSFRAVFHEGRLWVGSHTQIKRESQGNVYWKAALQLDLASKLCETPGIVFYGEIYGWVQKLRYGAQPGQTWLRFFDALDLAKMKYLDYEEFECLCFDLDLPKVPQLYCGPWSDDLVALAEGQSLLASHIREGFVVKPFKERFELKLGRVILKMIGEGYMLSNV